MWTAARLTVLPECRWGLERIWTWSSRPRPAAWPSAEELHSQDSSLASCLPQPGQGLLCAGGFPREPARPQNTCPLIAFLGVAGWTGGGRCPHTPIPFTISWMPAHDFGRILYPRFTSAVEKRS